MGVRLEDLGPAARAQAEKQIGLTRTTGKKRTKRDDGLEIALLNQLRAIKAPKPQVQYKFHPTRGWRFDFAWPEGKIAAEVDGATWRRDEDGKPMAGGHTSGSGYQKDCIKGNEAVALGWRVLHFTSDMIRDDSAAFMIERVLRGL